MLLSRGNFAFSSHHWEHVVTLKAVTARNGEGANGWRCCHREGGIQLLSVRPRPRDPGVNFREVRRES